MGGGEGRKGNRKEEFLHNRISARSALECVSLATALDLGEPIESRTVLRRLHPPTVTPREKGYVSCNANFAQIQSASRRDTIMRALMPVSASLRILQLPHSGLHGHHGRFLKTNKKSSPSFFPIFLSSLGVSVSSVKNS